jgi:predicted O-methyltransferase YrrM
MMLSDAIRNIVNQYGQIEATFGNALVKGSVYKRIRYRLVADLMAEAAPGDLAEVGVRYGLTTVLFAMAAEKYGRRVLAVDQWQGGYKKNKAEFDQRMKPWTHLVDVVHANSHSKEAKEALSRGLSLAFLDADHSYEGVKEDLGAVSHACVVILDDVHSQRGTGQVWRELRNSGMELITHPRIREGYIVNVDAELDSV